MEGEVDGIQDHTALQVVPDLGRDLGPHTFLGLAGRGAQVGCGDDMRMLDQPAVFRRLDLEHVQRRTGELSGLDRIVECGLVDQTAASAVDQPRPALEAFQQFGVDQVLRVGRDR